MSEYLSIGATIIASLGGSGAIILGLSNYLGKIWAERLMATERANHEQKLERLRIQLQKENQLHLAALNNDLDIYKQTHLREHSDKLVIYRATIDLVAMMLAKVEMIVLQHKRELSPEEKEKEKFETERLKIYGYLAMIAPQEVMDANDAFIDQLLAIVFDGETTSWEIIRTKALCLTNAMRRDIGIDKSDVAYNGNR